MGREEEDGDERDGADGSEENFNAEIPRDRDGVIPRFQ
jgi:hypothetical protein